MIYFDMGVALKLIVEEPRIMHVATARLLGAAEFVSTDLRQIKAAKILGLRTINLTLANR
ncbi:hypothetical protein BH20VER2_BH20VER2_16710 [soil metagenome]